MASNRSISDLSNLAKTSVDSNQFLELANKSTKAPTRFLLESLFPSLSTTGTGGENIWVNITNKNQLNFKGIESASTRLTVTTASNNILLTLVEAAIDLNACDNTSSSFLKGMDFTGTISGINPVVNGGTGINAIPKGGILYGSAQDTLASTAAPANGEILMGNATLGYPVLNTLTAGSGMTITPGAGTITLAASLTTMAGELNMNTHNVNLNTAEGESWISGAAGQDEGLTVDVDGKVFIGEATPNEFFDTALNIKGSITFDPDTAPTIKPKIRAGSAGVKTVLEGGSASGAIGGDLDLKAGSSTSGNHNGGTLNLYGGDEAGNGTAGSIKNFVSNGSGGEVESLTITGGSANPDVTVGKGNLIITEAEKGIVHSGMGTVIQSTDHTTEVEINSTSGKIQLAAVALAAATNVEFTVQNDSVQADSVILLSMQDENTVNNASLTLSTHTIANNSFKISIHNPAATGATSTTASFIHFLVINNSIAD